MAVKIRRRTSDKVTSRGKRKARIRSRVFGTSERPRLAVYKSNANFYAQLINDEAKQTIASVSTNSKGLKGQLKNTVDGVKSLGSEIGKLAKEKQVSSVVFDRSGYIYHGKVKAFAEAARESGLQF